jgi:hypothetical protein
MDAASNVKASFEKALDAHGYAFAYSVMQRARDLYSKSKSTWAFEVSEFPVAVATGSTRIDFVLRQASTRSYLIAECKRANPALSNWCFAAAPFVASNFRGDAYMVERAWRLDENDRVVKAEGHPVASPRAPYHIALEIRSDQKGDCAGSKRGAIEDAVTQVLRGMNGFVRFLALRPRFVAVNSASLLVPVVFTTARLWTSDVALDRADLNSGKVDFARSALTEASWLVYQHFQSPELSHEVAGERQSASISKILENDYMRSVAIVSREGIEEFLGWASTLEG